MTAFLRVSQNGQTRDVAVIPTGRLLIVGRSEQADVSFPQDELMSSRHLSIQLRDQKCLISDLGSTNGTTVNGAAVTSATVGEGDIFCCGKTVFSIDWPASKEAQLVPGSLTPGLRTRVSNQPGESAENCRPSQPEVVAPSSRANADLGPDLAPVSGYASPTAMDILKRFRLRQSIPVTPEDAETTEEFLGRLARFPDGTAEIEFLSFALPKRCAVWWLIVCARKLTELREEEMSVLELGQKWVIDPTDKNRRMVFAAAREEDPGRPAHWVGSAAYFSGGSIAPENSPTVAPQDRVTGQCVHAGITMAGLAGAPHELQARRKLMSQLACQIAADGIHIEES